MPRRTLTTTLLALVAAFLAAALAGAPSHAAQEPTATPTPTSTPVPRVLARRGTFGGVYVLGAQENEREDELGRPAKHRKTGKRVCELNFASLDLKLTSFAGPFGACSDSSEYVYGRVTTGWRTDKGLLVGDASSRIKQLYPKAAKNVARCGSGDLIRLTFMSKKPYPKYPDKERDVLLAEVRDGKVVALEACAPIVWRWAGP